MKVLQISNKLPYPPRDGGAIATLSMSRSFAMLGHKVDLLSMNTSKHFFDPDKIPEELKSQINFYTVNIDTCLSVSAAVRNFIMSKLPYNAERFVSDEFSEKLTEILRNNDYDIIQLEGLYVTPYMEVIRKNSKAKVSMRAHNIEHEIWERTTRQNSAFKKIYLKNLASRVRRMELEYMNSYDCIVPITERDARSLMDLGCKIPCHVSPTGIFTNKLNDDRTGIEYPSVFQLGALDWGPNQEGLSWFLTKVWTRVQKNNKNIRFYIAGRNAPPKISNIKAEGVEYIGEVDDAYDFMRSKAIMVVPLLSGSGMRIKIIEGMALGKSIVTTSIGTEGIETTHGENIFIADSPEEFAENIQMLLDNYQLFESVGKKASDFVRLNYDNLDISKKLIDFYNTLL